MNVYLCLVGLQLLKVPVEIATANWDTLVIWAGTVAENEHWIFLPVILPFTESTGSCRAKTVTDDKKESWFSVFLCHANGDGLN